MSKIGPIAQSDTSIITNGLIFNMDFSKFACYPRTGTTITDLKGSLTGTLINGAAFDSNNLGYIDLDGVDDSIDCGNDSSLNFNLSSALTGEIWVNFSAANTVYKQMMSRMQSSAPFAGWEFAIGANTGYRQSFGFFMRNNEANPTNGKVKQRRTTSDVSVSSNVWLCLGFTYDGSGNFDNVTMYKNGEAVASEISNNDTMSSTVSSTASLTLGTRQGNNPEAMDIAVAKLYEKELTAVEMLQNYNALKERFGL